MAILVVDDERLVCQVVKLALARHGLQTIEAHDGPTALAAAREARANISLLLTDINMPGMNGIELASSITAEFAHIPVLFMSCAVASEKELNAAVPGSRFIKKPFVSTMLVQAVKDMCAFAKEGFITGGVKSTARA
jgi:CheY-like chemotaxis protein